MEIYMQYHEYVVNKGKETIEVSSTRQENQQSMKVDRMVDRDPTGVSSSVPLYTQSTLMTDTKKLVGKDEKQSLIIFIKEK